MFCSSVNVRCRFSMQSPSVMWAAPARPLRMTLSGTVLLGRSLHARPARLWFQRFCALRGSGLCYEGLLALDKEVSAC